ncbi:MAG TPA: lipid-A-disaccharide synthase [Cyclobacteriaceae bacterium]|nr:lipid-A-disaccharide synthase [Cyclobacteriaceae bacterium]
MKIYLIAGERSGDLHGGNLIKALKNHLPEAQFRGFGGDYMKESGMEIIVHYHELAFMGFAEVLANLRTISKKLTQCQQDILQYKPDVIVLIDYAGFNMRVAKFARKNGIKVFWYISPKVWAWNQNRALKLKSNVDRMFVILPFEKDFFKKYDWDVDYVGNPVLDAVKAHQPDGKFLARNYLKSEGQLVALLPGSRKQELQRMIPLMASVAAKLPRVQFGVATVSNLNEELYAPMKGLANVRLINNATYDLLTYSHAAIVTSGTATLETALFRVPQVVVYKTSGFSYRIAKMAIRVPYISLVNLIAGREVVEELIQDDASEEKTLGEIKKILEDSNYKDSILNGYDEIIKILDTGSASENAATLMTKYLK